MRSNWSLNSLYFLLQSSNLVIAKLLNMKIFEEYYLEAVFRITSVAKVNVLQLSCTFSIFQTVDFCKVKNASNVVKVILKKKMIFKILFKKLTEDMYLWVIYKTLKRNFLWFILNYQSILRLFMLPSSISNSLYQFLSQLRLNMNPKKENYAYTIKIVR